MLQRVKRWFIPEPKDAALQEGLDRLKDRTPVPVFWLFGKTQTGKTSVVKYLTGADDAEVGFGFRPCTRFSRQYQFPTAEAPLLSFLDTRGLDEPGYDPAEDLASFNDQTHVLLVTVKALDHAQEHVLEHLRKIRQANQRRPVVLVLTCLHEAYPQRQHVQPYPFTQLIIPQDPAAGGATDLGLPDPAVIPEDLRRSLAEQVRRFGGLADYAVPVDLTPPGEGFNEVNYGGTQLKQVLLDVLPAAYRQTLAHLEEASRQVHDFYARPVLARILGYSSLAATAATLPMLDVVAVPAIQRRMVHHLAQFFGRPERAQAFLDASEGLSAGAFQRFLSRKALKTLFRFGRLAGGIAGGVLAGASTFALGKAFCYYHATAQHEGHVPTPEELRSYYDEQLLRARQVWGTTAP